MSANVQGSGQASAAVGGGSLPIQTQGTDQEKKAEGQIIAPHQQDTIASAAEESKGITVQVDAPKPQQPGVIEAAAAGIIPPILLITPQQLEVIVKEAASRGVSDKSPAFAAEVSAFLLQMMAKMYDIGRAVLDGWIKNLQEEADRVQKYLNSSEYQKKLLEKSVGTRAKNEREEIDAVKPKAGADFQTEIVTSTELERNHLISEISPSADDQPIAGFQPAIGSSQGDKSRELALVYASVLPPILNGFQRLIDDLNAQSNANTDAASLKNRINIAVSVIMTMGVVTAGIYANTPVEASLVAYNPIVDSINAATQSQPSQLVDQSAAMAMIAALLGSSLIQSATAEGYLNAQAVEKEPNNSDMAQAFVGKVFTHIYSPEFEETVLAILVPDTDKRAELSQDPVKMLEVLAPYRFANLAIALDVVIRASSQPSGGENPPLDGERFLELLTTPPEELSKEEFGPLLSVAQDVLRGLNLQLSHLGSDEARQNLKLALAAHLDSREDTGASIEEYFQPLKNLEHVFRSLLPPPAPISV